MVDQLADQLALYGVPVLAGAAPAERPRPLAEVMADLAGQPVARLHTALTALLLARPEVADALPAAETAARGRYGEAAVARLRTFYQAAVYLQRDWKWRIALYTGRDADRMADLDDRYGPGLGLPGADDLHGRAALVALAEREGEPTATFEAAVEMLAAVWAARGPRTFAR